MRIGSNPEKNSKNIELTNYHRIIVPVYIPNFEGYFKETFEVFKLCIESLLLTIHDKTRITIYNNNCHQEVKKYIDEKYQKSEFIDQVFHSKENLGKINAILAASKGNLEPIITITDADVLFKNNWQNEVEKILVNFPEAGMVSPVPSSKTITTFTANNWGYALFKGKIYFDDVLDPDGLMKFDNSLGNSTRFYKPIHLKNYLVLKNKKNKQEAVMGCGHFVATLKREVLDKGTSEPAFIKIQKGVESKFIDYPNEKLGFLRLATKGNYAFHMGNTTEDWMYEEFNILKNNKNIKTPLTALSFNLKKMNIYSYYFGVFINKLLSKAKIRRLVYYNLGLKSLENY